MALARAAQRYAQDQGQERSERGGPQALEAEGHRPRACRLNPVAALAPWRHGPRTEAARLQLCAAEENGAGRAAFRALRETGGAETHGCGCMDSGYAQNQSAAGSAGKVEPYEVVVAGGPRREPQSGTCEPQPRRCHAGRPECPAALRRAEA